MSVRRLPTLAVLMLALILAGCGTSSKRGGAYYKDDGPHASVPSNLDSIPDAVPRLEPLASGPNRPYVVFGKRYVPDTSERPYRKEGLASWYGKKFHGNPTSNGESYDMYQMTAAHPTLPIPSYARVTSRINGRSIIVRVNDRGPFHSDRIMDLSYVAAHKLGIIGPGSGPVLVERILPAEIRAMQNAEPGTAPQVYALPQAPAARPVTLATGPGIYLQLGAFSQADNAHKLANRVNDILASAGPAATIEQTSGLFRVRMGPYASREAAQQAASQLAEQTGLMPSVAAQ
ncbi:septal ring lytic transglycosylase RlpA family protein [Bordetella trematum]|uniref:septal ring lytic transglycosylase RlpA family protein n=1 Tax=Bordetella trematum TaxID=123899 RepID=UPI00052EC61A|nr:septal ring lytic transglycosylase RlpA family protein [Bordetella trematum]